MAPRDVKPGAQYADAIVRAINEAQAMVLVMSGSAVDSAHVAREVERAASKRKRIITFRIDGAALSPELEYFLSNSQWIEVPKLGMPAALAKLAVAVGSASTATAGAPALAKPVAKMRRLLIAVALAVGVGIASVLGVHFWSAHYGGTKAPASAAISDTSIAVLPFSDLSEKRDQAYFADGLAQELVDVLGKLPNLRVIGHTSSFQFKGRTGDLSRVGSELGAAHLVEGSVRRSGDRIRVTAQLVRASDGAHEWSGTFDRSLDDLLQVQTEIAM